MHPSERARATPALGRWVLAALLICATRSAWAGPGVTTSGGEGFLGVPAALTLPPANFALAVGVGARWAAPATRLAPGPLAVGVGLPPFLEAAFSLRQQGTVRDRVASVGAMRLELKAAPFAEALRPLGAAAHVYLDHLGDGAVVGGRLLLHHPFGRRLVAGAYVGGHSGRAGAGQGPEAGLALEVRTHEDVALIAELEAAGARPTALLATFGARYILVAVASVVAGAQVEPMGERGARLFVGLNMRTDHVWAPEGRADVPTELPPPAPRYSTERPAFRMRIPMVEPAGAGAYRPLHPEVSPPARADDVEAILDGTAPAEEPPPQEGPPEEGPPQEGPPGEAPPNEATP